MKKKTIVDLIVAHYEEDDRAFFANALEVLKEFKNDGDKEIADRLDFVLKSRVKIAPKRARSSIGQEVSYEDAADLGWVPMMEPQNKNHGCGTTFDDLVDMADKIDMSRKEEASRYLDGLLRKKQLKDNQILIDASLLIRDKPYRKALRALIKKHKVKVVTVFLGSDEGDVAMIYNKELNCLAINENTSWQNTLTALNRIAEMDSIPRDKDYQFVIGWGTK